VTARPKLTPTMRDEMIERRLAGARIKVLAFAYGVSERYVKRICPVIHVKVSQAVRNRFAAPGKAISPDTSAPATASEACPTATDRSPTG
jgi:hypothetical protein